MSEEIQTSRVRKGQCKTDKNRKSDVNGRKRDREVSDHESVEGTCEC